jgi:hypothetical protein
VSIQHAPVADEMTRARPEFLHRVRSAVRAQLFLRKKKIKMKKKKKKNRCQRYS